MSAHSVAVPAKPMSIGVPLAILAVLGVLALAGGKVAVIFCLLLALMLTGMPISIALGLTVLTFLFTMTQVPI
ncbi:MAG: C4-dicarboxylate ABC transporter permease, partial [Neisseriaceae bacterium]